MKIFDKKLIVIYIFLLIIIFISFYFFTKDNDFEFISSNELYVPITSNTPSENDLNILVHIDGEVLCPGIVSLPIDSRISDAIEASGGATDLADISQINLAYKLKDGQKIHIPSIYDEEITEYIQNDAGNNVIAPDISSTTSLININSATQTELETLPGIGSSTALKIIDYREKNGNFKTIEDIMNVTGIGEAKFQNIKDYICI